MLPTTVLLTICDFLHPGDRFRLAAITQLPFVLVTTARTAQPDDVDFATAVADVALLDLVARAHPSALEALPPAVEAAAVDRGSALGRVAVLNWWHRRRGADIRYTVGAVDEASANGHTEVLQWFRQRWRERPPARCPSTRRAFDMACLRANWGVMRWWRESGLSVTCSGNLLDALTAQGRLDVIRWLRDGGDVSGRLAICYPWKFRYSSYPARSVNIDEGYPTSISWHPMAKNVLYVTEPGLIAATRNGHLQVLLWWRQTLKSKFPRRIHSIMDIVSKTGRLEMLDFWRKSGVKLKYSTEAVDDASARGDLAVLRWWEASGLRLKYTEKAIDQASCNHHLHVLNWWRSSRFTLEYSQAAIDSASRNGHAAVLQWWKDSGLELKYSAYAIDGATQSGHVEVLQWWMDSGLEIKCLPVTVNEALSAVDSAVAEWWLTVGLAMLNSRMTATDSAQTTTPAKKRRWWWWS